MRRFFHKVIATVLFIAFLSALTVALEGLASTNWLGPVLGESLRHRFDAGALFYTEVDIDREVNR